MNERQKRVRQKAIEVVVPGTVILDSETTDLNGYLVEVGVLDYATGETLFHSLVRPEVPISEGAQAVHGITDAMLANAPTFADIFEQLTAVLKNRTVLVYNAAFDRQIVRNELKRLGIDPDRWFEQSTWFCVMELYSAWVGDWSSYHGNYRWQRLPSAGHRALDDCRATRQVIKEMLGG